MKALTPQVWRVALRRALTRATEHELHIALLWFSRATAGWSVHRAIENFFAAVEERLTKSKGGGQALRRALGTTFDAVLDELVDAVQRKAERGMHHASDEKEAVETTQNATGDTGSICRRIFDALPQAEAKSLVSVIINRMAIGGLFNQSIRIAIWTIPTILLFYEVSDLRNHNAILEKQVNSQVIAGIDARDLEYLRILSCRTCETTAIRQRIFLNLLQDERQRNTRDSRYRIRFENIFLDHMYFGGLDLNYVTFNYVDLSSTKIEGLYAEGVTFSNVKMNGVNLYAANLIDAIFSDSDLTDLKLSGGVCLDRFSFLRSPGISSEILAKYAHEGETITIDGDSHKGTGERAYCQT